METLEEILSNPIGFLLGTLVSIVLTGILNFFFSERLDNNGLSLRQKLGTALAVFPKWIWTHKFYALLLTILAFWGGYATNTLATPPLVISGFNVPLSKWTADGVSVSSLSFPSIDNTHHVGVYELKSTQDDKGYTSPTVQLDYVWKNPGSLEVVNSSPIRGIQTRLKVLPNGSRFNSEYVFCHYSITYNNTVYTSTEQHIPFNQWVSLAWDFTGRAWDLPAQNKSVWDNALTALNNDGPSYTYFFRRLGELWQYQDLVLNNYNSSSIEKISLTCNVSATRELTKGNSGDIFAFEGKFYFGDVFIIPYEYEGEE